MLLHRILFFVLSSMIFTVKCQIPNDTFLNISIGIVNARTVIGCGLSMNIYSSFDPTQIMICPYVSIQQENIHLIDMTISVEDEKAVKIYLSSQLISPPELMIKHNNNSLIHPSNLSQTYTYYLPFSSELTCRYSSLKNTTICFYYPSSMNFHEIECYFEQITNISLISSTPTRQRLIIIIIVLGILVIIVCLFGLYLLCTTRLPFQHMIQLDYIIDPKLAREAALKLGPEPV